MMMLGGRVPRQGGPRWGVEIELRPGPPPHKREVLRGRSRNDVGGGRASPRRRAQWPATIACGGLEHGLLQQMRLFCRGLCRKRFTAPRFKPLNDAAHCRHARTTSETVASRTEPRKTRRAPEGRGGDWQNLSGQRVFTRAAASAGCADACRETGTRMGMACAPQRAISPCRWEAAAANNTGVDSGMSSSAPG